MGVQLYENAFILDQHCTGSRWQRMLPFLRAGVVQEINDRFSIIEIETLEARTEMNVIDVLGNKAISKIRAGKARMRVASDHVIDLATMDDIISLHAPELHETLVASDTDLHSLIKLEGPLRYGIEHSEGTLSIAAGLAVVSSGLLDKS